MEVISRHFHFVFRDEMKEKLAAYNKT